MKRNFFYLFSCYIFFSFSTCEPLILPKISGNTDMAIYLISIPSCILNEPNLEIKTQVYVDGLDDNAVPIALGDATFYSSNANNNPSNIWHLGVISVPETGFFSVKIKSKVVIKDSPCDKPFYPRDAVITDPANQAMYSDRGCCFTTQCCGCTDRPDSPPTFHVFNDRVKSFSDGPGIIDGLGHHLSNSLVCSCCDY